MPDSVVEFVANLGLIFGVIIFLYYLAQCVIAFIQEIRIISEYRKSLKEKGRSNNEDRKINS